MEEREEEEAENLEEGVGRLGVDGKFLKERDEEEVGKDKMEEAVENSFKEVDDFGFERKKGVVVEETG
jgi:hypothetical protein